MNIKYINIPLNIMLHTVLFKFKQQNKIKISKHLDKIIFNFVINKH